MICKIGIEFESGYIFEFYVLDCLHKKLVFVSVLYRVIHARPQQNVKPNLEVTENCH